MHTYITLEVFFSYLFYCARFYLNYTSTYWLLNNEKHFLYTTRYSAASYSVPTWLDDLRCTSTDTSLLTCSHRGIGVEDCSHSEDVAISCSYSSSCSGMLFNVWCRVELASSPGSMPSEFMEVS